MEFSKTVSIGTQLKQAREEKQLSIEQAASKMHLPNHIVQDLENDIFSNLPETYNKGYLRNYSKLLGLNADAIIAHYDRINEPEDRNPMYRSHIEKEQAERTQSSFLVKFSNFLNEFKLKFKGMNFSKAAKNRYLSYIVLVLMILIVIVVWKHHHTAQQQVNAVTTTAVNLSIPTPLVQEPVAPVNSDSNNKEPVTEPVKPAPVKESIKPEPAKSAVQQNEPKKIVQHHEDITSKLNMDS